MKCGFRIVLPLELGADEEVFLEARVGNEWKPFFWQGETVPERLPWYAYAAARLRARATAADNEKATPYEGLDQGYVCWIDHPRDWRELKEQWLVAGWCFRKGGQHLEEIRAWLGSECYHGRYRLPRPDVAAFLGDRPDILESGFDVRLEDPGDHATTFRLEARQADGVWREVFRKQIRASGSKRQTIGSKSFRCYQDWIKQHETLSDIDREAIDRHIKSFGVSPRFAIVMELRDPDAKHLAAAIRSVRQQNYPHWTLSVRASRTTSRAVERVLERCVEADRRIFVSKGPNEDIRRDQDSYLLYLGESDELAPTALYHVAAALNANPSLALVYSDEDELKERGLRDHPSFKPDWNETLFREQNYLGHFCVVRSGPALSAATANGRRPFDWVLQRIREADGRIGHLPRVLYHRRASSPEATPDGSAETMQRHLDRQGISSEVTLNRETGLRRVRYLIAGERPTVSIVIPTRDMVHLLQPCLDSILKTTSYRSFDVLVIDNGTKEPSALDYLERVSRDSRVRVLCRAEEFNYSRLNNFAAEQSQSEFVALLNNDVVVIRADWLEELVSQGLRPGVGAVGPRLLYPDGRIQQAGVILGAGLHGVAEVVHRGLAGHDAGYESRAALAQELSAVGAACMLVRRSVYLEVGGFDEEHLKVAFNDVDFCLKLRQRGYRIVYTPHTELYHLEHASRGWENTASKHQRFTEEIRYMKEKWQDLLVTDPAYNPNLSLGEDLFRLACPPRVSKPWLEF